jgi:multimeric flavodoxin WrbA
MPTERVPPEPTVPVPSTPAARDRHMPTVRVRHTPTVRKGQGDTKLSRQEFARRFREQFYDPAFDSLGAEIEKLTQAAWDGYDHSRKSPRTAKAGPGFADPNYDLSIEWSQARAAIRTALEKQRDRTGPRRVLLISASSRTDETCPGEMAKSFRLVKIAESALIAAGVQVDLLDLSALNAEYGRRILPCKGCVSTAMPLCHWPCSCYPNHSLGQVHDWMNELYPRFTAAHGIMIVTPVYWYQSTSPLKLLMDRLVCADGGNPDPTSTQGKDAEKAKAIEMKGWDFPRHLAGRAYSIVVHGDAAGADDLRRLLCDWLNDMGLVQAGHRAAIGRYIDYYGKYATAHEALDHDDGLQAEVGNAAKALAAQVELMRDGRPEPDAALEDPRPK